MFVCCDGLKDKIPVVPISGVFIRPVNAKKNDGNEKDKSKVERVDLLRRLLAMVKSVMIEKDLTENQASRKIYDEVYRDEQDKIKEMIMKKQLAEVELLFKTGQILSVAEMETWSEEKLEFYKNSIGAEAYDIMVNQIGVECNKDINKEVVEDRSGIDQFLTQDVVSNVGDYKLNHEHDTDPSNVSLREEEMLYASAFREAALDEEKLLQQKTMITWLKDGDFNSSFFHNYNAYEVKEADSLFTKRLDADVALDLIKPIHDKEIKEALFSIDDNKASGPNGYSFKFFKAAWSVVGQDLCFAAKEFFTKGNLLSEFNTTLISLVPKVKSPASVIDYMPISCCNVVYKVIRKIITNRLKLVLNDLVDVNQSAFILDILKAYDTVSWPFFKFYLRKFGFHPIMINSIMTCLATALFSLCINGESHGVFKAKKGLRQGDPISPYLFTLVIEVLNLMIKRHVRNDNRFKYHSSCGKLEITSLCFANDLLLLCYGDLVSVSIIRRGLDEFSLGNPCPRDEIANIFVSHFMSFLGTQDDVFEVKDADSLFTNRLHGDVALDLIKPVYDKEIKEALFNIDDNKASRPNRYSFKFFKAAWSVVGQDLCSTVKEFFAKGKLPNILKAYDTVSWSFFKFYLRKFGFHPIMINSIMTCLATALFSLCINGESHGFFKAKRGLRQGDPISPYLFTLVIEVLNLMIKRHVRNDNRFKYHSSCGKLEITSLCFADDLLLLCYGDLVSVSIIRRGLDEFSLSSGLHPSMSKSEAFFCGLTPEIKNDILMLMPFKDGTLPIRYLGVPLVSKKINVNDYDKVVWIDKKDREKVFSVVEQKEMSVDTLFDYVVNIVRYKLKGLSLKQTDDVVHASRIWNLPFGHTIVALVIPDDWKGSGV
nr:hypothetical protein [Tanacetum cinerariifolium]